MNTNDLSKSFQPLIRPPTFNFPKDHTYFSLAQRRCRICRSQTGGGRTRSLAPKDHDVLIQAFNISVREIRYIEPHTFLFSGFNHEGHHTAVVAHYSQVVAHIVYLPKQGPEKSYHGLFRQREENC